MVQRIQDERNNPWGGEIESSFDLIIVQWKIVLKVSRNDNSRYSHLGVSFSSDRGQSLVGVGGAADGVDIARPTTIDCMVDGYLRA